MDSTLDGTGREQEFADVYENYVHDIYRLCFSFMKNHMDAEDAVQETFLKYYRQNRFFQNESMRKAWLIVTASNQCKDMLKHWWRRREDIEDHNDITGTSETKVDEMMELILALPKKYKTAVYLYYYEQMNSKEIAAVLHKPDSTIRTYLQKARQLLRKELE